jgi:16S rRNA (adenine1518-N6/adenine1519-N6)-dimethyltransferase
MHHAKKSLGQNFLKSEAALRAMCTSGSVSNKDTVVEIGPGKGALTTKLLECAQKVIAVEKDRDLIKILEEKFKEEIKSGKLDLIEGDILEFDPAKYKLLSGKYKIIANIPYNITGAIFKKFLSGIVKPETMVLLVQKEVAQRIVANDGKESILSLSVKVYGNPKYVMKVGKRFFSPSPKVDSAIVAITGITEKSLLSKDLEEKFFEVVKLGFAHKRKVLRKNLEDVATPQTIESMFGELGIDAKSRAEDLPLTSWLSITKYLA